MIFIFADVTAIASKSSNGLKLIVNLMERKYWKIELNNIKGYNSESLNQLTLANTNIAVVRHLAGYLTSLSKVKIKWFIDKPCTLHIVVVIISCLNDGCSAYWQGNKTFSKCSQFRLLPNSWKKGNFALYSRDLIAITSHPFVPYSKGGRKGCLNIFQYFLVTNYCLGLVKL